MYPEPALLFHFGEFSEIEEIPFIKRPLAKICPLISSCTTLPRPSGARSRLAWLDTTAKIVAMKNVPGSPWLGFMCFSGCSNTATMQFKWTEDGVTANKSLNYSSPVTMTSYNK